MIKAKKQFCINGHDTFRVGRDSKNRCRQCARDYKNKIDALKRELASAKTKETVLSQRT